jgi:hypothetical protein
MNLRKINVKVRNTLRDERNHIEGILNQRFNFFIVILGFIVAAIPYVKNLTQLMIAFIAGTFIEIILTCSIGRAQRRLDVNIEILKEKGDIIDDIEKRANKKEKGCKIDNIYTRSFRKWIGYYTPFIITVLLIVFSIVLIYSSIWNGCIYDWLNKEFFIKASCP